jgi:hypothetical protein
MVGVQVSSIHASVEWTDVQLSPLPTRIGARSVLSEWAGCACEGEGSKDESSKLSLSAIGPGKRNKIYSVEIMWRTQQQARGTVVAAGGLGCVRA